MANVIINGVVYNDCGEVNIPLQGGGTARYLQTDDATLNNANQMLSGVTAYSGGTKYTGNIPNKSAQTFTPTTSDQTINAGQYLTGAQIVKGDVNLKSSVIKSGVSIFGVQGSLTVPNVSQDSVTKVLSIS